MLSTDRAILRNVVIAIVASSGALLGIGTFVLGRDRARPPQENVATVGQQGSVRSSAGGVPPAPIGTTIITSGQLERGASASGPARGAPAGRPAVPPGAPQQLGGLVALPPLEQPAPHTHTAPQVPPPAQVRGNPAPTPMATPMPSPPTPPPTAQSPAPSPIMGVAPAGAPPNMGGAPSFASPTGQQPQPAQPQPAPTPKQAGAGAFTTEPSPFSASAFPSGNEEADAGAGPSGADPSQAPH